MTCKNKDLLIIITKLKWNLLRIFISKVIQQKKNLKIGIIKITIHKSKAKKSQLLSGIMQNLLHPRKKSSK